MLLLVVFRRQPVQPDKPAQLASLPRVSVDRDPRRFRVACPWLWPGYSPSAAGARKAGAVADVVESYGGVVSGLFNQPQPALARRRRLRHGRE
jgi:hypothetical protein